MKQINGAVVVEESNVNRAVELEISVASEVVTVVVVIAGANIFPTNRPNSAKPAPRLKIAIIIANCQFALRNSTKI